MILFYCSSIKTMFSSKNGFEFGKHLHMCIYRWQEMKTWLNSMLKQLWRSARNTFPTILPFKQNSQCFHILYLTYAKKIAATTVCVMKVYFFSFFSFFIWFVLPNSLAYKCKACLYNSVKKSNIFFYHSSEI